MKNKLNSYIDDWHIVFFRILPEIVIKKGTEVIETKGFKIADERIIKNLEKNVKFSDNRQLPAKQFFNTLDLMKKLINNNIDSSTSVRIEFGTKKDNPILISFIKDDEMNSVISQMMIAPKV